MARDEGKIKGRMQVRVKHNGESLISLTMNREEKARERFVATGEGITVVLPDEPVVYEIIDEDEDEDEE